MGKVSANIKKRKTTVVGVGVIAVVAHVRLSNPQLDEVWFEDAGAKSGNLSPSDWGDIVADAGSQAAFDTECGSHLGSWYNSLSAAQKAGFRGLANNDAPMSARANIHYEDIALDEDSDAITRAEYLDLVTEANVSQAAYNTEADSALNGNDWWDDNMEGNSPREAGSRAAVLLLG